MSLFITITMLLCGLWHGASWNYVVWGGIQGVALAVHRVWTIFKPSYSWMKRPAGGFLGNLSSHALTLGVVLLSLIFFRAHTTADALYVMSHLFSGLGSFLKNCLRSGVISQTVGAMGFYREEFIFSMAAAAFMFAVEFLNERVNLRLRFERSHVVLRWAAYYVLIGVTVFYGSHSVTQQFIYFQF
jgi:D-alanyl-lipoteichoic acid acyltransferase DltB (MBOAT superfamily)